MTSVEELYELWSRDSELRETLKQSLEPRGTEWLHETFAALGPQPGQLVVDVGARDAGHTIRLVQEHGLRAIALEPLEIHRDLARKAVAEAGLELDVITAVVIGGVNVFGGSGTILGVVLGAVLVATIQDGFTLLRISEFWKIFFNGAAIVAAVTIDALITQRLQEVLRRRRRAELLAHERGAEA